MGGRSIGSYFLGIVGAVIGFYVGGPAGASAGFALGAALGSAVLPADEEFEDAGIFADLESQRNKGTFFNSQSTVEPINVIYGRARLAGARVYVSTTGTNKQFLHQVLVWCEGEIDSVEQILLNDEDGPTVGGSFYEATHHLGTDTQAADANLVARDPNWTAAHRLRGVAYTYLMLTWDAQDLKYEAGVPVITAIVKGKKVFDPRTSTTAWSDNPALCLWDFLTNERYGKGIPSTMLDQQTFEDAADFCDELVSVPDGAGGSTTQKRYTCNGVMKTTNTSIQNLKELLTSCRGTLLFSGGKYKLKIDKTETATFTFDESNILGAWVIDLGSKTRRLNKIKMQYFDPDDEWKPNIQILDSPTFRAIDKDLILERSMNLPFTNNGYTALHLATIDMKASRQTIVVELTASLEALEVEVNDVVKITHTTPGWTEKLFRVTEMRLQSTHEIRVGLREYEASTYSLDTLEDATVSADTNLPSTAVVAPPSNVQLSSGDNELFVANDGTVWNTIKVTWDPAPDAFVQFYEIQFKRALDSIWTNIPNVAGSQTEAFIVRVEDGIGYDVRIRSLNFIGKQSPWETIVNHTVIGKSAPPPDVTTFLVQRQPDGTREFTWTLVIPPKDLAGYKIRFVSGTGGTWGSMSPLHSGILVSSPHETNQLAAGTYTFGIKAVDTSGNESANAKIIETTLDDPRIAGAFSVQDFHKQGWPGTLTQCDVDNVTNDLVCGSSTDWDNLPATWDAWTAWNNQTPYSTFTFESNEIDLGGDVYFTPLTSVAVVNGNAVIEYDWKLDGGSYNGTWQTVTDPITARYIKVRITTTVSPSNANDSRLTQGLFIASGEVISEEIIDLDMTDAGFQATQYYLATGDIRLPIQKSYAVVTSVSITLQNVGAGYSWELIDKDITIGPRVKIYDSGGSPANVIIDAVVRGLGA